ncbi:MAG: glycosyltransferase family 4 protein [Candidatus Dormibacteraeota bacterium]|nr:glycosyltransferase family 4 protein [Candidatus Dormibacteraeota bacterium]
MVVDGSALAAPNAGMGTYTREILESLGARARFTVYGPGHREIPRMRLLGRHLFWPRRIRRLAPDLFFGPMGQLPLGRIGASSVLTIHDLAIYIRPEWFPPGQPLSTRLVVPRSIERATRLIAVSHNTARDIARIFDRSPDEITVIHEGVGRAFHPIPVEELEAVRARYELPERFVLFVGTIEPRKNLRLLLQAWTEVPDRPPLVIAGPWGWRFEGVRDDVQRLGHGIQLLGGVPPADLPALYNLATLLAHPALYEGFGLTPLESMACGTPVVSSNAASLPEVVGDAGLLVDPQDGPGWTAAIDRVLHDPGLASDLRRRGILRAAEFTWEKAAARTWRVLEATAAL